MEYNVSDSDVQDYLDQLKVLTVTIGSNSYSGTQNLKELLQSLKTRLESYIYETQDKITSLSQHSVIVQKNISSIESKYQQTNLHLRYQGFLENRRNITVNSPFMTMTNRQLDTTIGEDFRELELLRKEKQELSIQQNLFTTYKEYLEEMKTQLDTLIQKCSV